MKIPLGNSHVKSSYYSTPTKKHLKQIRRIRKRFYMRDVEAMRENLKKVILKKQVMIGPIYEYFFARIANDAKRYDKKGSINQALESDLYLTACINQIRKKPDFYNQGTLVDKLKQSLRTGGIGGVKKLANFPIKPIHNLSEKYDNGIDKKIYVDTSCGWGSRMLGAASLDMNYVGFEVNTKLIRKLKRLGKEIQKIKPDWKFLIIEHGSEKLFERLSEQADFMLTSPPYFCLEDYCYGDQSFSEGMSYKDWCKSYLKPLMANSFTYCKPGAYCLINIKDFAQYDLVAKTVKYGKKAGFKFICIDTLKLGSMKSGDKELRNMDEPVIVFQKPE